jgi:hypothetical protein
MDSEPLFKDADDLRQIESLVFDPNLEPSYDIVKGCLVWSDERPKTLTPAGYESLYDLLVARSFLHRGLDFSAYDLSPDYFRKVWDKALAQGFKWPGFNRLTLSEKDKAYYEQELEDCGE